MAVSETRIKRTRLQLAVAAMLVVSACTPQPHEDGTVRGDAATNLRLGDEARAAGDLTTALPLYQRAYKLSPEAPANQIAALRVAATFNQLGAYHEAGDIWSQILRLDQDNFDALVGYGVTLTALRQPVQALEHFEQARAHRETDQLLNGIGVAHDISGNAARAQDAYRSALKMVPNSLRTTNNLGLSLALSGDYTEAIELLEKVTAMPGATVRHRQNLSMAYWLAGFSDRSRAIASQDLDDLSVQRNMGFYRLLAQMDDHAAMVAAVSTQGTHTHVEAAIAESAAFAQ